MITIYVQSQVLLSAESRYQVTDWEISMILRKIQTYNHKCNLMKLGISIEIVGYLVNN